MKKPHAKDYLTDFQMHAAMEDYARFRDLKDELGVYAVFEDGSGGLFDVVPRFEAPIKYRTADGEEYEISYRSNLFTDPVVSDTPLGLRAMKEAYTQWMMAQDPRPTTLKFMKVPYGTQFPTPHTEGTLR